MSKSTIIGIIILLVASFYMTWQLGRSYGQQEVINALKPALRIDSLANFA